MIGSPDTSDKDDIRAHYGTEPFLERVESALAEADIGAEVSPAAPAALGQAGFEEVDFEDRTESAQSALAWFTGVQGAAPVPAAQPGAGLDTVMGPESLTMGQNLRADFIDGRVGLIQLVVSA